MKTFVSVKYLGNNFSKEFSLKIASKMLFSVFINQKISPKTHQKNWEFNF